MKNPILRFVLYVTALLVTAVVSYNMGSQQSNEVAIERPSQTQSVARAHVADSPQIKIIKETVLLESSSERWQQSISRLSQEEAPHMLEQLHGLKNGPEKSAKLRDLFKRWGELDGPGALVAIETMRGRERLSLFSEAVAGWGRVDPAAAWEELMQASNDGRLFRPSTEGLMRGGVKEPQGLSAVPFLKDLASRDVEQAFDLLESIDSPRFGRKENFHAVLEVAAANGDYDTLLGKVLESESGQQTRLVDLFNVWGRYDLDAPLSALGSLQDTELAERAMTGLMNGWASVDGQEAFSYALENSDDPKMKRNLGNVARILAQSSTASEIVSLFDQIEDPEKRTQIASSVIGDIARADPQSAFDWASSLGNEKTRDKSLSQVLRTWAQSDFASAKEMFLSEDVSDSVRDQSITSLVLQSRGDPQYFENTLDLLSVVKNEKMRKQTLSAMGSMIGMGRAGVEGGRSNEEYVALLQSSGAVSESELETFRKSVNRRKKKK